MPIIKIIIIAWVLCKLFDGVMLDAPIFVLIWLTHAAVLSSFK